METEVVCPDCGKAIAPRGSVEEAARCRCGDSMDRTSGDDSVAGLAIDGAPKAAKTCYICSEDLTGKPRFKDKLGRYWCKPCAKADDEKKAVERGVQCPDCLRYFPEHKLIPTDLTKVCSSCNRERAKNAEKRLAKTGVELAHRRFESGRVKLLIAVVITLFLVATVMKMMQVNIL